MVADQAVIVPKVEQSDPDLSNGNFRCFVNLVKEEEVNALTPRPTTSPSVARAGLRRRASVLPR